MVYGDAKIVVSGFDASDESLPLEPPLLDEFEKRFVSAENWFSRVFW